MIVSIHQPAYIPWIGYFDKIYKSDIHIFLDDVEYSKNNLFNRNKIKVVDGEMWLTVPIKYKSNVRICDIKIDNDSNWQNKHWKSIKMNYAKAPYFKKYSDVFEKIYSEEWLYLSGLTIKMNKTIADLLGIETKFLKSSELGVNGEKNERLINLCKAVGADTYLSGLGAKSYMDDELFTKNNIKVQYQKFNHPEYKQLYGEFIPNLSIIDFLFNSGEDEFSLKLRNDRL